MKRSPGRIDGLYALRGKYFISAKWDPLVDTRSLTHLEVNISLKCDPTV